jgi:hypothetical protein
MEMLFRYEPLVNCRACLRHIRRGGRVIRSILLLRATGPRCESGRCGDEQAAKVDKRVFFIEVVSLFDLRRSKCTVPAKVSKRVKSMPWAAGGDSRVRNTRASGRHRAQALRGRGEPR